MATRGKQVGFVLFSVGVFILAILGATLFFVAKDAARTSLVRPSYSLPLLLLVGIAVSFALVTLLVGVFRYLNLTDSRYALALPEGSIRALIALSLIFLFFVMAVFLYFEEGRTRASGRSRLTATQVAQLPANEILEATPIPTETGVLDVTRQVRTTESARDLAKQLLTTVSTLVVAIAAFYFGSASVLAARGQESQPTLMLSSPTALPVALPTPDEEPSPVDIRLEASPESEPIVARVEGDDLAQVRQIASGHWQVVPSRTASDVVKVTFALVNHPDKSVTVEFRRPPETAVAPEQSDESTTPPPAPSPPV